MLWKSPKFGLKKAVWKKPPVKCTAWIRTCVSPWAWNMYADNVRSAVWQWGEAQALGCEHSMATWLSTGYNSWCLANNRPGTAEEPEQAAKRSWLYASQEIWLRVSRLWLSGATHRRRRRLRWTRPHHPRHNQPPRSARKSGTWTESVWRRRRSSRPNMTPLSEWKVDVWRKYSAQPCWAPQVSAFGPDGTVVFGSNPTAAFSSFMETLG